MSALPAQPHLEEAHRRLRHGACPLSLPDALTHPIYGPCVRGLAHALERDAVRTERRRRFVQTPARLPSLSFDPRRAAANDLDD